MGGNKNKLGYLLFVVLAICNNASKSVLAQEESTSNVTINPIRLVIQVGEEAHFKCGVKSEFGSTELIWKDGNGTELPNGPPSRITWDINGNLTIINTTEEDTGEYKCETKIGNDEATCNLKVYIMPSYWKEGIIVLSVDGVLLVLFLGCWIHSQIKQKQNIKKFKEAVKHGVHKP